MVNQFEMKTAKVLVVEPAATVRQMICDIVRDQGFTHVASVATCKDALSAIEVDTVDWFISPLMSDSPVNALQMLRLFTEQPKLKNIRCSFILSEAEQQCIPLAFELGLMSWHQKTYVRDQMREDFQRLDVTMKSYGWNTTLLAAHYLRPHLKERRHFASLLQLEESLNEVHSGNPALLLHLAEAQILNGRKEEGFRNLRGAEILDRGLRDPANVVKQKYFTGEEISSNERLASPNVLGIKTCLLVDGDVTAQNTMRQLLTAAGVTNVQTFGDGKSAMKWCKENPEPDLIIQEWRIPQLTGPILIQRVRQHGFVSVPIIVASSLVKSADAGLLREMSAASVIDKPFDQQTFFKTVIWTLHQSRQPTEQNSLERKIRQLLHSGKTSEAERLKIQYFADTRIQVAQKKLVEAEFEFHYGRYARARDVAIESLKISGRSILTLNLIGKALMKLKDYSSALKFLETAQSLAPQNIERLCQIAEAQIESGATGDATSTMETAQCLDPENEMVMEMSCNTALVNGDSRSAKQLMKKMDSVLRIVSYMNNRAVALSRCNRFEDGIALYGKTLDALPEEWSHARAAVNYNLGLALTRYGELEKAVEPLRIILQHPCTGLHTKAASLVKRLERTVKTGVSFAFSAQADDPRPQEREDPSAGPNSEENVASDAIVAGEVLRGDICCYLVFRPVEALGDQFLELLKERPRFMERSAIERDENILRPTG